MTNQTCSEWAELLQGVSQGLVLGVLPFNICLKDLFFLDVFTEVCNIVDGNTFCDYVADLVSITNRL